MNTLQDLIKKYAAQYKEQVIAWRRHIHSHPELSGQEKETSFFIEEILKKEGIHIALDTSGVGKGYYQEILSYVDLVLLDIKHITDSGYLDLTGSKMTEFRKFVTCLNESGKKVWIRQVIVPGVHDNMDYINGLASFLKQIKNIEKVEFLPYHKLGDEKYTKLGILNPYQDKEAMDTVLCENLYQEFEAIYYERNQRD